MFDFDAAIRTAMKARDPVALGAYRALKTKVGVRLAEPGREGKPLSEEELVALARREIKERHESNQFLAEDHPEHVANAAMVALLEGLLPSQPSPEETEALIQKVMAEVAPTSAKEMGKVMGKVMAALREAAPGLEMGPVSARVKALLAPKG